MSFITNLYHNNPIVAIILVLMIITTVVSIIRGLLKLAFTIALIAVVAVVFFHVNPDSIIKKGQEVQQATTTYYQTTLKPIVNNELSGANYQANPDGSYLIKTSSLSIQGKKGQSYVVITYKNTSTKVDASLLGDSFKQYLASHN
jgi:ABC-type transport system involved in cytochrome bd biosynthesis fused ATPase/permease subunit